MEIDRPTPPAASDSQGETRDTINIAGNQFDDRANRGVSDFDRTHRLWPASYGSAAPSLGRALFSRRVFFRPLADRGHRHFDVGITNPILSTGVGIVLRFERREQRLGAARWATGATV